MSIPYNIYCDESCHLLNDKLGVMVLGAIWTPSDVTKTINQEIRQMKIDHGFSSKMEIKWIKVSPGRVDFYKNLVEYFLNNKNLHFRALIIPDKSKLVHSFFNQTHDDWYYKMYFDMLKIILDPANSYQIYVDIKDTKGGVKVQKLHSVLCNNFYDFSREIIEKVQIVRSHEIEILQLTDLLIGAVSYANRKLSSSEAKDHLVQLLRERTGYKLTETTLYRENKMNLFKWIAQEENDAK